ncbi:MAG: TraB/GumN family protein, partial [Pseudomonadota bacterium]
TITMFGTYHFRHAQTDAHLDLVKPQITAADVVFLEMSPEEQADFQNAVASDPQLMFITAGPTLPDLLGEEDWTKFKSEMSKRGFPGIMSAKLKPLWAAMMLGIGPCEAQNGAMEADGIDALIGTYADENGKQSRSLEDFRTVLTMLDDQPMQDQIEMIRLTLDIPVDPDDMSYTIRERYLNEEIALTWQFAKAMSLEYGGPTAAEDFAELEEVILTARNLAWVDLLSELEDDNVFAAFGAGHLPGKVGVLYLLEQQGYEITRLPLPQ